MQSKFYFCEKNVLVSVLRLQWVYLNVPWLYLIVFWVYFHLKWEYLIVHLSTLSILQSTQVYVWMYFMVLQYTLNVLDCIVSVLQCNFVHFTSLYLTSLKQWIVEVQRSAGRITILLNFTYISMFHWMLHCLDTKEKKFL